MTVAVLCDVHTKLDGMGVVEVRENWQGAAALQSAMLKTPAMSAASKHGPMVGASLGTALGASLGATLGTPVGMSLGVALGASVGISLGMALGETVGVSLGIIEGS